MPKLTNYQWLALAAVVIDAGCTLNEWRQRNGGDMVAALVDLGDSGYIESRAIGVSGEGCRAMALFGVYATKYGVYQLASRFVELLDESERRGE